MHAFRGTRNVVKKKTIQDMEANFQQICEYINIQQHYEHRKMVVSNDLGPIVIKTMARKNGRRNVNEMRQRGRVLMAMAIDVDVDGIRKWQCRRNIVGAEEKNYRARSVNCRTTKMY